MPSSAGSHLDPHVPDLRETARRRSGMAGRRPDGEDHIRTARAKGPSERRVVYKHALRGAVTPTVTMLGIDFATIMAGLFITENLFGLLGLGQLAVRSIATDDFPIVMGVTIVGIDVHPGRQHRRGHRVRLPRSARPPLRTLTEGRLPPEPFPWTRGRVSRFRWMSHTDGLH